MDNKGVKARTLIYCQSQLDFITWSNFSQNGFASQSCVLIYTSPFPVMGAGLLPVDVHSYKVLFHN